MAFWCLKLALRASSGAAVARELSKFSASVLLLEAGDDISQGATKGNSGIVHAGYDDKPGSHGRLLHCELSVDGRDCVQHAIVDVSALLSSRVGRSTWN